MLYLRLLVLISLAIGQDEFADMAAIPKHDERVVASYRLTLGVSLAAAIINAMFRFQHAARHQKRPLIRRLETIELLRGRIPTSPIRSSHLALKEVCSCLHLTAAFF